MLVEARPPQQAYFRICTAAGQTCPGLRAQNMSSLEVVAAHMVLCWRASSRDSWGRVLLLLPPDIHAAAGAWVALALLVVQGALPQPAAVEVRAGSKVMISVAQPWRHRCRHE